MEFNTRKSGFIAQINVVPFVDVMLVLLVIFMITAPFMTQGVEVDLPRTKTVKTLPESSQKLVLNVEKDKTIHLQEYELELQDLAGHLKKVMQDKQQMLYLRADRQVPYGFVVKVMGRIKDAGVETLGVVAEREDE
ncbi:MAG: ExbD/TolR family protein [Desulfohalobiaceae bacterium]|nr:ExbD/TolR family protein [Desulfohalobiaceae bacterium]